MLYKITFYCHPSSRFLFSEWFWKYFASKSSSSDVFAIKSRLERRPTTSLASAYTHGPKQIPSNLFWCSYYIKKFFKHSRTKCVTFKILIFDQILPKFRFWRAFGALKTQKSWFFMNFWNSERYIQKIPWVEVLVLWSQKFFWYNFDS